MLSDIILLSYSLLQSMYSGGKSVPYKILAVFTLLEEGCH